MNKKSSKRMTFQTTKASSSPFSTSTLNSQKTLSILNETISHFVSEGTRCLLRGDLRGSRGNAYFAYFFQHMRSFDTERKMINSTKLMTLYNADEHTLCCFFRNRIPCSCLKNKYKEVRSLTKTDVCWNIHCSQTDRLKIDKKSMMRCSRCHQVSYCCRECQKIDWPRHKINCGLARDIGALFGAQNMDELENKEVWARTLAPFLSRK